MLYTPGFELASFDFLDTPAKVGVIIALTEALAQCDYEYLRVKPNTPSLYRSGVRYKHSCYPLIECRWVDIPRAREVNGDCKDLAAWRVAELRIAGELDCRPRVEVRNYPGHIIYHVVVQRADGTVEDPSKLLGM